VVCEDILPERYLHSYQLIAFLIKEAAIIRYDDRRSKTTTITFIYSS